MSATAELPAMQEDGLPPFDALAEKAADQILASALRREGPWAYYRALRERAPIYYSRQRRIWFMTSYHAVEAILKSSEALLEFEKRMDIVRPDWRSHPSNANVAPFIAFVDGAAHKKIRSPLSPYWTPKEMERYRQTICQIAEAHVDRFVARGGGSFPDDVAFPFAEASLYKLFAFEGAKMPNARDLVHRMQLGFELDVTREQLEDADAASVEYRNFWQAEYRRRGENPVGDDMLAGLLRDPSLTTDDVALIAESLFSGGFDSTALTMTTGMWLLANHPDQMALARKDPAALDKIPEEMIRMGSGIPMTLRVAVADITLDGFTVKKGDLISVVLGAANRDPEKYENPEAFDLTRPPYRTLAFSYGAHACLGQWFARVEMRELFKALLERTRKIEIVGEPMFRDRQSVRGMEQIILKVE